ncbi:uncharacterized protein [Gossypium hirsutum]|uniref:Uncharacterized protein isoform X2 n=1 Tax=Gossypium hirsutum TaxID=3635 RepID=A0ABM3B148_GOSHI|nr:uncharacterized protein LOC121223425 isoform X2 [Gossypium hirsutum]XP_040960782.1 uncharacterized protein LOC121223425 isoform X2 [Gossypium hirsutum]
MWQVDVLSRTAFLLPGQSLIFRTMATGDVSTIGLKPLTGCGVNTSGLHVFSNLTQLKLGCNEYCGQLLPKLLEKSPNLEVLILGKDNAKLNTRDLVKIHMGATAVRS